MNRGLDRPTIVKLISEARIAGRKIDPTKDNHGTVPNISEAITISLEVLGVAPSAWKLGGSNHATRATFGVTEPYFGPLNAQEVFRSGASLTRSDYPSPLYAEPEIVVALKERRSPAPSLLTASDVMAAIDWVAPALELPSTVLMDPQKAGVHWLVADRCAAGALVVGDTLAPIELSVLENAKIDLLIDGTPLNQEQYSLVDGVIGTLTSFLGQVQDFDLPLPGGTLIATGGLSPSVNLSNVKRLKASFGQHTVQFGIRD